MTQVRSHLIVDGMNIAFRAHHIYDKRLNLQTSEGHRTGTVYGFLCILSKWRNHYPHHDITIVWDRPGGKEWRQAIVPSYKANRMSLLDDDSGEDYFSRQLGILNEILPSLGVNQLSASGQEADDMIAYAVKVLYPEDLNIILSSDRDMLQLVTHRTIQVTPDGKYYDIEKVLEEYGVQPELLVDFKAMIGDSSDNLPGIPRLRKKTVASLVNKYGSLDSIYSEDIQQMTLTLREKEKITSYQQQTLNNFQVMSLITEVDNIDHLIGSYNKDEINTICDELELDKIRNRLLEFNLQHGFLKHVLHTTSGPQ